MKGRPRQRVQRLVRRVALLDKRGQRHHPRLPALVVVGVCCAHQQRSHHVLLEQQLHHCLERLVPRPPVHHKAIDQSRGSALPQQAVGGGLVLEKCRGGGALDAAEELVVGRSVGGPAGEGVGVWSQHVDERRGHAGPRDAVHQRKETKLLGLVQHVHLRGAQHARHRPHEAGVRAGRRNALHGGGGEQLAEHLRCGALHLWVFDVEELDKVPVEGLGALVPPPQRDQQPPGELVGGVGLGRADEVADGLDPVELPNHLLVRVPRAGDVAQELQRLHPVPLGHGLLAQDLGDDRQTPPLNVLDKEPVAAGSPHKHRNGLEGEPHRAARHVGGAQVGADAGEEEGGAIPKLPLELRACQVATTLDKAPQKRLPLHPGAVVPLGKHSPQLPQRPHGSHFVPPETPQHNIPQ
mmetsp:Transcript_22065/g.55318  ORF Transcript_22065/g.55318 Transcript_22065/m.55318 type:complete len:409 (-) Transcript_22065:7-1233(-)